MPEVFGAPFDFSPTVSASLSSPHFPLWWPLPGRGGHSLERLWLESWLCPLHALWPQELVFPLWAPNSSSRKRVRSPPATEEHFWQMARSTSYMKFTRLFYAHCVTMTLKKQKVRPTWVESHLCHFLTVWHWTDPFSLSLRFLLCKKGVKNSTYSKRLWQELNVLTHGHKSNTLVRSGLSCQRL